MNVNVSKMVKYRFVLPLLIGSNRKNKPNIKIKYIDITEEEEKTYDDI